MIGNYNCKKAYVKSIDPIEYLENLEKAQICFESAEFLINREDIENAYIVKYRGIQLLGNAVMLKLYKMKSKEKNCQFQYLYNNGVIEKNELNELSKFSLRRNDIYYNNYSQDTYIDKKIFKTVNKNINKIIEKLRGIIAND